MAQRKIKWERKWKQEEDVGRKEEVDIRSA
jgi:hypothetical protein